MIVPTKLKIGKKVYAIKKQKFMIPFGTVGSINYDTQQMLLATHSNSSGKRLSKLDVYDTFWHELTHAILKDMGSKLEKNERFVDAFSRRLTQAIVSARFT